MSSYIKRRINYLENELKQTTLELCHRTNYIPALRKLMHQIRVNEEILQFSQYIKTYKSMIKKLYDIIFDALIRQFKKNRADNLLIMECFLVLDILKKYR